MPAAAIRPADNRPPASGQNSPAVRPWRRSTACSRRHEFRLRRDSRSASDEPWAGGQSPGRSMNRLTDCGTQERNDAGAVARACGKLVGHDDFGRSGGVRRAGNQVDHARQARRQYVPLPGGILEPNEFGESARQGYQVWTPVPVDVERSYLVAALESVAHGVSTEGYGWLRPGCACQPARQPGGFHKRPSHRMRKFMERP